MKTLIPVLFLLCFGTHAYTQSTVTAKLSAALRTFERDSQLRAAITSLYVVDANTGRIVFARNEGVGMAPASTQKIITAATAYALLGKNFRYATELRYAGIMKDSLLDGNIYIIGDGDPTLGSWRYKETLDTTIIRKWALAIRQKGIANLREGSSLIAVENRFEAQAVPDGWIWQDIGNYYGAGGRGINWKENQFDLVLRSGSRIGDPVTVQRSGLSDDFRHHGDMRNELRSAATGTGDNAYIYMPLFTEGLYLAGTIPVNERNFTISGSVPHPYLGLLHQLGQRLRWSGPMFLQSTTRTGDSLQVPAQTTPITTHQSPPLDSIIYWFQRRSINLYGEALVKTFSLRQNGFGATDSGVTLLKKFWTSQGIPEEALNMVDGSGLSPLNRVTTQAQVAVLRYARQQPWFSGYLHSFPEFNGMKMKSGTIRGVKGFAGYHKSKSGAEYIFSFIVNNYNGSSSALVRKMYAVLDALK